MKQTRRRLLTFAASACAAFGAGRSFAKLYPARPIRLIVPFPAGGPSDIMARLIGQPLAERLGQPVVIDNRPGASGNTGTSAVILSAGDGYTLLLVAAPNAINAALYTELKFDLARDLVPVASIGRGPLLMLVNPSLPATTVPQFLAYARERPGALNLASPGIGTPPHVAGELLKVLTGIDMVHVPYRGVAPALNDLIGGQVQVMFDPLPSSIGHVRSGQLRGLAVTTMSRSEALPSVPCLSDFVPGYETSTWFGVGAPRGIPGEIVDRLNHDINAALADRELAARLAELGSTPLPGSPAGFGELIASEIGKWRSVIKAAGIKPP